MRRAARLPIRADRHTPCAFVLRFKRLDLTGAEMRVQVRLYPDAGGAPLIALSNVSEPRVLGLWLRDVEVVDGQPLSVVEFFIPEALIEGLPNTELGQDLELAWDMTIKPIGGVEQKRLFGPFTVIAGVTK